MGNQFKLEQLTDLKLGTEPLVSVVIDNYNYGRFLAEAIESVLNQTYKNFELIVVDDGSTDHSRSVIESYGDRVIPVFQSNAGQGAAFSAGVEKSQGEIICFLDADDYFHPEKLAKVVQAFQAHPEWVQISHHCVSVDEKGVPINRASVKSFDQGDVRNLLLRYGKYKWMRVSGRAYRRDALLQVLPIASGRNDSACAYLLVTVPFYGEVGGIDEALMFYRVHGKNRHAGTTDLEHLVHGRELIAEYVNSIAAKLKLTQRLNVQKDADYRTFKAMQFGAASLTEALQISWLAFKECLALRRSSSEIVSRLMWGGICTVAPAQGRTVLQHGLKNYLRWKVLGKELKLNHQ